MNENAISQGTLRSPRKSGRTTLYDFERTATPRRIRMEVCGRCGRWETPMEVVETPCLKDGTPHFFESHWYVLEEPPA